MPEVIFHEKRRRRVSKQMIQVHLRKKVKNDSIIKVTIEISYFKVDVNLIYSLPDAYLGNFSKFYDMNH